MTTLRPPAFSPSPPPPGGLPASSAVAALRSRVFWVVVLPLLWAMAYLPALGTRALRLEEGRRATPAREMLQTGNFVQPTLYGEAYLNKPPMFFWIVAGTGALLGGDAAMTHGAGEWAVRLPSVVALLGGVYLVCVFARKQLDRATRGLGALLLLSMVVCMDKGSLGEIESVLSLLVFAATAAWWQGYRAGERHGVGSWVLTGVFLSLAMLTKGPPAVVVFYVPLVAFLIWQRDVKRLFSLGHAVCVGLVVVPMVAWVWAIRVHDPAAFDATVQNWLVQMGVTKKAFGNGAGVVSAGSVVKHYVMFPVEALIMLLPAVPLAIAAMFPRIFRMGVYPGGEGERGDAGAQDGALRRYLVCAIVASSVFFWLWPSSRPRHMMAVCYPTAVLGAIGLMGVAQRLRREKVLECACGIMAIALVGRGIGFGVLAAIQGPTDQPRVVAGAIVPDLPKREPVYTLITFASRRADRAPDLYNIQFYLGRKLVGLSSLRELPADAPATVLLLTRELEEAKKDPTVTVRELGSAGIRKMPSGERLHAVEVVRSAKQQAAAHS